MVTAGLVGVRGREKFGWEAMFSSGLLRSFAVVIVGKLKTSSKCSKTRIFDPPQTCQLTTTREADEHHT
jgi:hypothetical protein